MGNINVTKEAYDRLNEMAVDDDRKASNLVQHLINKEWRGRKGIKSEYHHKECK